MTLFADTAGERLDAFLARSELSLSRSAAQKLLDEGCVTLNGKAGKKNDRLTPGDTVEVTLPEPKEIDVEARDIPLDIVYEDEDVVVINKPKGLVVHPAPGHQDDTLVNGLLYALGDSLSGINGELRPGIVHRIDKDTSGLLAVAKNDLAHAVLASQLVDHTMARTYEAIVCGTLKEDSGTVDAPIGRHPTDRKKCASPSAIPKMPSPTGRWCSATGAIPTSAAIWKPAEPIRFASIWPISVIPFWGTRFTGTRKRSWGRTPSASTPGRCASAIPGTVAR